MKQRNFVAKNARSSGAGRHTIRTKYIRKEKHPNFKEEGRVS